MNSSKEAIPVNFLTEETTKDISLVSNTISIIQEDSQFLQTKNSSEVVYLNVLSEKDNYEQISEHEILVNVGDQQSDKEVSLPTENVHQELDITQETEEDIDHPSHLHVCPRCKACFATSSYLKTHLKRKCIRALNMGNPHQCKYCNLSFKHRHQLTRHTMQHSGERPFKCEQCEKTFLTKSHLKRHAVTHEPDDDASYNCTQCDKVFAWRSALEAHIKSHTGEKRFKCGICGRMFLHLNSLRTHMINRHTVNGKYICVVCKTALDEPTDLILHMKTHKEEESVKCDRCHAFFSTLKDLETHVCTNFGGKPLICNVCSIEFPTTNEYCNHECIQHHANRVCGCCQKKLKSLWHLREHLITHTGEKPFKCEQCQTSFRRKRELDIHSTRHGSEKPFKCSHCDLTFSSANYMKQHLRKEHREKKFVCEICNHAFMHKCSLTNHMSFHLKTGNTKFGKRYHRDDGMLVKQLVKERMELEGVSETSTQSEVNTSRTTTTGSSTVFTSDDGCVPQPSSEIKTTTTASEEINKTDDNQAQNVDTAGDLVINVPPEVNSNSDKNLGSFSGVVIEPNTTNEDDEDATNATTIFKMEGNNSYVFRCVTCMHNFFSHGDLLRHRKDHHNDGKPYQCDFCSRTFAVAANLSQHRNIHNIKHKYSCCHCGKSYKITHKLREHLKIKHNENTDDLTDLELRLRNSGSTSLSELNDVLTDGLLNTTSYMPCNLTGVEQIEHANSLYSMDALVGVATNHSVDTNTALFQAIQGQTAVQVQSNTGMEDQAQNTNELSDIILLDMKGDKNFSTDQLLNLTSIVYRYDAKR